MRYVITTWYESPDGTKYMESAPDFVRGNSQRHIAAAREVMSKSRPDFDIVPANAVAVVLCESYFEGKKYGTATEAAEVAGIDRRTLASAMERRDDRLEVVETHGGTLLVSIESAKRYAKNPPKRGPKPKD